MEISIKKLIGLFVIFGLFSALVTKTDFITLRTIVLILIFWMIGSRYGTLFFGKKLSKGWRLFWGTTAYTAVYIIASTAAYLIADASAPVLLFALFVAALPTILVRKATPHLDLIDDLHKAQRVIFEELKTTLNFERSSCLASLLALLPIAIDIALLNKLHFAGTNLSIISPWVFVTENFFVLFAVSTALLLIYTARRATAIRFFAIMLHVLLFFSAATLVYQVGFGFDGFIHRTAETIITEQSILEPKTPYYIGQYMTVGLLHYVTEAGVDTLDRWLLPIVLSILIPLSIFWFTSRKKLTSTLQPILLALLFPLPLLIATTPQAIALILLATIIFLTHGESTSATRLIGLILALSAFAIHPLAGIPAILYMIYTYTDTLRRTPRISFAFYTLGAILALPAAAYIQTHSLPDLNLLVTGAKSLFHFGLLTPPDSTAILQFVYGYKYLFAPILFLMFVGLEIFHFNRVSKKRQAWPLLLMSGILLFNAALYTAIEFPFVISYEQNGYSERLLFMALLFLFPLFVSSVVHVFQSKKLSLIFRLALVMFTISAISSSFYLSYPRLDRIERSKAYSTSIADIQTVARIKTHANKKPYVVLSNQSVSAAAIAAHRFASTVQIDGHEQFIYPVPTGGPLYPYYLKMVYDGDYVKTANDLKEKTGVERVYFVLNNYWTASKDIVPLATEAAEEAIKVQDSNWIFVF